MNPVHDATDPLAGRSRSGLGRGLNALGVVVVAVWFVRNGLEEHLDPWVWAVGAVALAAWAVREAVQDHRVLLVALAVMLGAGALVTVPTLALLVVPVVVAVVALEADDRLPVWLGGVAALVAVAVVAVVALLTGASVQFVLGVVGGLAVGLLAGYSRRQARAAEHRARSAERDRQRASLLADRARAARDVHDVLAHSLGGLVLQLDAVEALLEAGRVDEAAARAGAARALAADGLAEARSAVRVLRDDAGSGPAPVTAADGTEPDQASRPTAPSAGLVPLVEAHRSFGGEAVVQGDLTLAVLDDAVRDAVVAAVREGLSNARRHAPGSAVSLSVIRDGDAVDVVVANPLRTDGHGLRGMRERFAELAVDATVETEQSDGEFVVAVHVPVAALTDATGTP